jgi:hypothetical protein
MQRLQVPIRHGVQQSSWSVAPGGLVRAVHHGATPRVIDPSMSGVRWSRAPKSREAVAATREQMRNKGAAEIPNFIAAVWVNPKASDEDAVFKNNRASVTGALKAGRDGHPTVANALAARDHAGNAFFRSA